MFAQRHDLSLLPLLLILCLLQLYSVKFVQADKPMSAEEKEAQIVSFTEAIKAADPSKGPLHKLVLHFSKVKLDDGDKPSIYIRLYGDGFTAPELKEENRAPQLAAKEGWQHLPFYYESRRRQHEEVGLDTAAFQEEGFITIGKKSSGTMGLLSSRTLTAVVPISLTEWEQLEVTNGLAIVSGRKGDPLTHYPNALGLFLSDNISNKDVGKAMRVKCTLGKEDYTFVFYSLDVDYLRSKATHSVVHTT